MKILYGVQGTGNGHLSRARMMARHLENRNVDVTYLFSGRPKDQYFDMEAFGDFICLQGFTFVTERGRIKYARTILQNNLFNFISDIRKLDLTDYDLILTDYEPVTAWAARFRSKPVIGIGHQYAFQRQIPVEGDNFLSRQILRHFAPGAVSLGIHWAPFDKGILPPIVDPELKSNLEAQTTSRKILVYLPFEDQHEVAEMLQQIPGYDFYQYGPGLSDDKVGQVRLRQLCHSGFLEDLASSSAVICNAGFELVSESLQLGLQVLVRPVTGQTEQLSNALAVQELGIGRRMDTLSIKSIADWLDSLDLETQLRVSASYPDVAGALVDWILEGDWEHSDRLTDELWSRCRAAETKHSLSTATA